MQDNLGELLVAAGMISEKQLATAKGYQQSVGGTLAQIITKMGFVEGKKLTEFMAQQEQVKLVDVASMVLPAELIKTVPRDMVLKHIMLPIRKTNDVITLAMADATNFQAVEAVQFLTGKRVEVNLADRDNLVRAIKQFYDSVDGEIDDPLMRDLTSESELPSLKSGKAAKKPVDAKSGEMKAAPIPKMDPLKKYEAWAPALIPLLLEKGIITEAELKKKLQELKGTGK